MENLIFSIAISTHLGMYGDYNEIHPHVQYNPDNGFIAGAYLNSENNVSAYVGYQIKAGKHSVDLGAVSGYSQMKMAPMVRYSYDVSDNTKFFASPVAEKYQGEINAGVVVGFEWALN